MPSFSIQVKNLGKKYRIDKLQHAAYKSLRRDIYRLLKFPDYKRVVSDEFWALKNLDLTIEQGEAIGIIGTNGSGKSTFLKLLSRVITPTEGEIERYGSVGTLLEVGTGFHPDLTGRENIFLSGAILGMNRREVAKHFDEIIAFSGVEMFLDTPVRKYSSGMFVRLGFAVMAHLRSDILIVDEVIAVGDQSFQEKCLHKMQSVTKEGRTVIFVSHDHKLLQNLCSRVVWLEKGSLVAEGPSSLLLEQYQSLCASP